VSDAIRIRRAVEADHPALVGRLDDWWGRGVAADLPRFWLQHFTGTSLVAETPDGRIAGFVVSFVSPDDPSTGYLHLVGVANGQRRRGTGRALVEGVADLAREHGATRLVTIAWPGDPAALAFLRAVGFEVDAGPGTQRLYGTPAHPDWNRQGDDQVVLRRSL
jgi:ribosomal protein S18 acetylase RimI-like enzyme